MNSYSPRHALHTRTEGAKSARELIEEHGNVKKFEPLNLKKPDELREMHGDSFYSGGNSGVNQQYLNEGPYITPHQAPSKK
jgi:hypothetical protein